MPAELTNAHFPFLGRLTEAARRELGALKPVRVARGEPLLQRGDPAGGAYLVVGGSLRVYYLTAEGKEATLYRVEPGGTCVLALAATFDDGPFPAWVEAGPTGGTFVRVPGATLHRLLDREAGFRQFVFGVLSGRVVELMFVLEELGSVQVEQRVARYLLKRCDADGCLRVTQVGIASDLGTAREVVFRALRSLAARRLVQTGRMRVRILDRAALSRAAQA